MVKEYYRRWVREHPRIQVYVSKENYDRIKELAFNMGLSVSELIRKAIQDLKKFLEESYDKIWVDGIDSAIDMIARGDEAP